MGNIKQFVFLLLPIWASLIAGYIVKRKGYLAKEVSNSITKSVILSAQPIIICLALWVLEISDVRILALPFVGFILSVLIILPAIALSYLHKHNLKDRVTYLSCGMFSNIGESLGGFVCFLLLGEQGLALAMLYSIYMVPLFYTGGFYIAGSCTNSRKQNWMQSLKFFFTNPLSIVPNIGLILGLILNFSRVTRPQIFTSVNDILIPLSTFLYMFSIGLTLEFGKIKNYFRECLSISFLKFVISPIIGLSLAYLLIQINIIDTLSLKVIFIESVMPVAISSLILSNLFELNQNLANSCWVFTTFAIVPWILIIYWVINSGIIL